MLFTRQQKWHFWVLWVLVFSTDISGGFNLAYAWRHSLFKAWLVNGWFKVDLVGDVEVILPTLGQYNLEPFFLSTDLINCVGYLLQ